MKILCLVLLLLPLCIDCNECENAPRIDCYGPLGKEDATETQCIQDGCTWCPTSEPLVPWCVSAQPACASVRVDCFSTPTNNVNMASCVAQVGCVWCPNPENSADPWCVRGSSTPTPSPPAICISDHRRIDCFNGANDQSDAESCNAIDQCVWCSGGQPSCLKRACLTEERYDCYWESRSGINKDTCEGNGNQCTWCPNPRDNGDPWCVESCPPGETLRYGQTDSCCVGSPTPRIVGGRLSKSTMWPSMGALFDGQDFLCGAVLISSTAALTAAHCFDDPLAFPRLEFGIKNLQDTSNRLQVRDVPNSGIIIHPNYIVGLNDYDIAILTFTEPINLLTEYVKLVDLPNGETLSIGTKCFVIGWGDVRFGLDQISEDLREVEVDIVDFGTCTAAYVDRPFMNSERQICAGKPDGGADACQGDSGGPLMCQRDLNCDWFVAGIVSFGTGCGNKNFPGVYTRVAGLESWVTSQLI